MRQRREALNLTQRELAERITRILDRDVAESLISKWENPKLNIHPDGGLETYAAIAKALDMNPVILLFGYDYPTAPLDAAEKALYQAVMEAFSQYAASKRKIQ